MAYLATVQLLIDAETESSASSLAQELLANMHAHGEVLDFNVDDVRTVPTQLAGVRDCGVTV